MADNARPATNTTDEPVPTGRPVEPFVDADHVAEVIGRPARWVREQAAAGNLPAYKVGHVWRFRVSEVLGRLGA
jgi:hypothetical protein